MELQKLVENLSDKERFTPKCFDLLIEVFKPFRDYITSKEVKIVTVGGTNGKGQTVNFLTDLYSSHYPHFKSMSWTSPHFISFEERFRLNGKSIPTNQLVTSMDKFNKVYPLNSIGLSFYELSFWIFCDQILINKPDILFLEVGLGGRLDTVNVFDADVVCLTSISRDHTEILGRFYRDILNEKIRLLRPGKILIQSVRTNYLQKFISDYCDEKEVNVNIFVDPKKYKSFKRRNFEIARSAIEAIYKDNLENVDDALISNTFGRGGKLLLPGKEIVYYNSHNLDGHRELLQSVVGQSFDRVILFLSRREPKELMNIYTLYKKVFKDRLLVVGIEGHFKVLDANYLNNLEIPASNFCRKLFNNMKGRILIVGSNYISQTLTSDCANVEI